MNIMMELLHFALCYCSAELHSPVGVGALVIAEAFLANTEDSFFLHFVLCHPLVCEVSTKVSIRLLQSKTKSIL